MADPSDNTLSYLDDGGDRDELRALDAQLFLLLRADSPDSGSRHYSLRDVDTVALGRGQTLEAKASGKHHLEVEIPDGWMSSKHAQMSRIKGQWILEDLGSKNGTSIRGQRIERAALSDGDLIELGQSLLLFRDAVPTRPTIAASRDRTSLAPPRPPLATFVAELEDTFRNCERVAPSAVPVMILGESGTGKEVVARAVHEMSVREGAFVAVNCGALPEHLVESELFGSKKGAFSGAVEDREGLVMAAHGGTLFLDEIGDLPEPSQVALLRVLQEKEVVPVGGADPQPVDFRLVVATHRDLSGLVAEGRFRNDLMARLSGLTVRLPALRERREDLGLLIEALLSRLTDQPEKVRFTVKGARALLSYDYPQNVRELERALELALALSGGEPIDVPHLPETIRQHAEADDAAPPEAAPTLSEEDQKKRDELIALLQEHSGNVAAVARAMGKARMQVHRWLRRFGINPGEYR